MCRCVLLCPCLGVFQVQLVLRHRDRRMLGSLLEGYKESTWEPPLLPGLSKDKSNHLHVAEFMQW